LDAHIAITLAQLELESCEDFMMGDG